MNTPMVSGLRCPSDISVKDFAKVTSPLGYAEPEEQARLIAWIASDEGRYMTGSDRLDGRGHHRMSTAMITADRPRSGTLIEARAATTPDAVLGIDEDARIVTVRRVPGCGRAAPPPGLAGARHRRGHRGVVAAADVDRVARARRRARPARCGAEPDAADLPPARGRLHHRADRREVPDRPGGRGGASTSGRWRDGSPSSRCRDSRCSRCDRRSARTAIRRRCRRRPHRPTTADAPVRGSSTRRARRPTRRARGTPTPRSWRRRTRMARGARAQPRRRDRARVPVHAHRRDQLAVHG